MTEQQPSVGRMVHYVSYGTPGGEFTSQCRAATITAVDTLVTAGRPDPVDSDVAACALAVLNPTGLFFDTGVPYSEVHHGGTWHWPERV